MGLASVWAEYGPALDERARGQNSIYRSLKSLPNPKDTYNSHIQLSEISERHSHSSQCHQRVIWEKILWSFLFAGSSSIPHQEEHIHGFQIRYVIYSFSPLKLCFVF